VGVYFGKFCQLPFHTSSIPDQQINVTILEPIRKKS